MTRSFRIQREAAAELLQAVFWYNGRRSGLGDGLLEATANALELIAQFPQAGSPLRSTRPDLPVRRFPLRRFPFHVIYIELPDAVRVLAFAHDRRSPEYWRSRIPE